MDKTISTQIADAKKELLSIINTYTVPQSVSFKVGQVCGKLDVAHREVVLLEDRYASLAQLYVARNPDKLNKMIQSLSELISGDNIDKEKEDVNNDRKKEKNMG